MCIKYGGKKKKKCRSKKKGKFDTHIHAKERRKAKHTSAYKIFVLVFVRNSFNFPSVCLCVCGGMAEGML